MKKLILTALLSLALLGPAYAGELDAKIKNTLKDSSGTSISSYSLSTGVAVFSESIYVADNVGFSTLLITEDKSGGAGDVDISVQYSVDGTNWYTAYDSDMAGTLTAEGNVVTALQNATRWIVHQVRLSKFMRYKFDPDADSQITAIHIYQKDR